MKLKKNAERDGKRFLATPKILFLHPPPTFFLVKFFTLDKWKSAQLLKKFEKLKHHFLFFCFCNLVFLLKIEHRKIKNFVDVNTIQSYRFFLARKLTLGAVQIK